MQCDICSNDTNMEGTRLCDGCYETLKWTPSLFQCFDGDTQISYERYQAFPWTVQLRQVNYSVKGTGQSLQEAYLNAKRQLMI